ncbi:MAG: peptidoglycan-binding protein [Alphaproteobacteria bacterium]|nr:peptidoglycan-binding protein [Alphaproteobacteria bacterium]
MTEKYSKKFERAFKYTITNEGVYANDPSDSGGETKYGISKRSYPNLDIKHLTLEEAKKIYFCDYWLKGKFEQISDKNIAIQLFDLSVNLGIRPATIVLQRALRSVGINVQEDGLLGPVTLSAMNNADPNALLAAIKSEAAGYYRLIAAKNPQQQKFLKGWLNRTYKQIN